ncbi:bifunctional 3-(3-hydroxy-phenyl)propionate/3-hydroxycinnamic acid hydroxylase [Rhizobium sp. Root1204]|uniref:bifunctional 3-(3-hydroxy-phenyl)propionate/3-hydroxycinnamic acid hydroxylase n=1 Tax=Rhizobium sp. Root1204 TaxID=1736428 RepID=UPI00071307FF|nr:bifunctional 3-(3-hydroxy-phenyl)propionate/3-hydroxycinnamic acid hydroxylase [Rhizobium sp. Root1204]KQV37000.1 hypothetical protein ASC96_26620 [Rhizobium sp. Root1204]
MTHYDAIISGCGPVGATLANLLSSRNLRVRVVEKDHAIYDKPRAIVLDWEAMRALQFAGIAHDLSRETKPHPGTDFIGVDGQLIKLFDPAPPPYALAWPATLTFVQPRLEELLRTSLQSRDNVDLSFGHLVTGFKDEGEIVRVDIKNVETGEETSITGDFLIGCDGSWSPVRTQLDLQLEDKQFDEWWVVVDALKLRDTPLPRKTTQFCQPKRPATYVVGPGDLRRWEIKILPNEDPASFNDPLVLNQVLEGFVDLDAISLWRSAVYRFHALVGESWRSGRVLLAGDAVHQMPPFLGQGLCAGIRDAFNLAWKIAAIQRDRMQISLLDTYEQERKPHVSTVIDHAKQFGLIIGELDEAKARERDRALQAEMAAGTMVTTRQGFIPNLTGGLIDSQAPLAGHLFVQPTVIDHSGEARLLDDVLPMEFLFVTVGTAQQSWLTGHEEFWSSIGGCRVVITPSEPELASDAHGLIFLREADGLFAGWAAQHGGQAFIVRPDRYVFGAYADAVSAASAIATLDNSLFATTRSPQIAGEAGYASL